MSSYFLVHSRSAGNSLSRAGTISLGKLISRSVTSSPTFFVARMDLNALFYLQYCSALERT